ncbi:MAG: redoxin family protein [Gammaproteobacteria bacterium]|nr:redoxin family protein [Gammaproteobacteria bacterium]
MKITAHSLFILISLLLAPFVSAGQYNSILNIGDDLPKFNNLPSISGNTISSDQLNDDILVFVSLANHCPWVKGMDSGLVALSQQFNNDSVRIIGLSMNHRDDDRLPAMVKHAQKVGYNFDYLYDESQAFGRALGATRTPEYFVFNKQRKLIYTGALYNSPAKMNKDGTIKHINGEPTEFYVENAILATLSNGQVNPSETRAHGCTVKYVN